MIFTIAAKELRSLFISPLAWVILGFLQLIMAWMFLSRLDAFLGVQSQLMALPAPPGLTEVIVAPVFGATALLLLLAVPLLSMRLMAEERRNQTISLLLSAPVSMTEIVLGKFLGLLLFLLLLVGLLGLMGASLYAGGSLDLGLLLANLLGLALMAASFAAVGLFLSCLTQQPVVAAIGGFGVLLGLWLVNMSTADPDSPLHLLSLLKHFEAFNKGMVDTADLAYFLLLIAAFLALSIRRLDGDRLRG